MKSNYRYRIVALTIICLTLLAYACKKINQDQDADPHAQLQAKELAAFKGYFNKLVEAEGRLGPEFTIKVKPGQVNRKWAVWTKAYIGETKTGTFAEIPIVYNQRISVVPGSEKKNDATTSEEIFKGSFDRLIIYKNKHNGKLSYRLITYIPDIEYLRKHHHDISHNQLNKLDRDFTGYLEYKTWAGKRLFIFQKRNGKTVRKIKYPDVPVPKEVHSSLPQEKNLNLSPTLKAGQKLSLNIRTKLVMTSSQPCGYEYIDIWGEQCISAGPDEGANGEETCTPYLIDMMEVPIYCDDDSEDGGTSEDYLTGDDCLDYGIGCDNVEGEQKANDNPCEDANKLATNEAFKSKIEGLKGKLNLDYETGYVYSGGGKESSDYTPINGEHGMGGIDFKTTDKIDGFLHTHYDGLFATFSISDVQAIYNLYKEGKINDINTFTATVVTSSGTYLLKIDDINIFAEFGRSSLTTLEDLKVIEGGYTELLKTFKGLGNSESVAGELTFLNSIGDKGLKFFKANSNSSKFEPKKADANGMSLINDNCN